MFCVNLKVSLGLYTELGLCPNMILTRLHPNGPINLIPDNESQVLSTTYLSINSEGVFAPLSIDHSYTKSSLQKVNPLTSDAVNELSIPPFCASLGNSGDKAERAVDVSNKPSQSDPKSILISNVAPSLLCIPLQTNTNPSSVLSDYECLVKSSVNQVVVSEGGMMNKSDAGCLLPSESEISSVSQIVNIDGEMNNETGCLPCDASSASRDTSRVISDEGMNDMSDTGFFITTKSMLSESGALFNNQVTKSNAGFKKLTETPAQESPSPGTTNLSAPPIGRPPIKKEKIKYPRQCPECHRFYASCKSYSMHKHRCIGSVIDKKHFAKKYIIDDCYVPKEIMLRDIISKNEAMRKLYLSTEKKWVPFSTGKTTGYVKAMPQKE